ncbi:MAG: aldo/keto reductase [Cyclobacteriaceae bacterium]
MQKKRIHPAGPEFSRIITGVWRWENLSESGTQRMIETSLDLGMTTFDHADIYGDHTIEEKFGKILLSQPNLRSKMELVSKCGIKFPSANRPANKSHIYDTSARHIIWSAENSLRLLNTDYLDLLLIHRPDPLSDPNEIAEAFEKLRKEGKVLHFGVSNFSGPQFRMLQKFVATPLVTNQIELSVKCTEPFFNGDVDVMMEFKSSPMAWSPMECGKLFDEKAEFSSLASASDMTLSQLALSWLLLHPSGIFPVVGTTKTERLREMAAVMQKTEMDKDTWFAVLKASRGYDIP